MFNIGGLLPNGAKIISQWVRGNDGVVLCEWVGAMPFVTWRFDPKTGDTFWGNYFLHLSNAIEDFDNRCSRCL